MTLTTEQIEALIDDDGAWNILLAIEIVLDEKADQLRVYRQDAKSARLYARMARKAGIFARELEQAGV